MGSTDKIVTIVFNNTLDVDNNNYDYSNYKRVINWNPVAGLVLSNGKSVMGAAMALAHELGHAAQHIEYDAIGLTYSFGISDPMPYENSNLDRFETPIAKELGEFYRSNYFDWSAIRKMDNSTDWGQLYNPHPWWEFWNWGNKSAFESLNSWKPTM